MGSGNTMFGAPIRSTTFGSVSTGTPMSSPSSEAVSFGSADNEYACSHYLLFGAKDKSTYMREFDCAGAREYLQSVGIGSSSLTQARRRRHESDQFARFGGVERYCDFCGRGLTGVEFEVLKDGRERCAECAKTAVRGVENYEAIFFRTKAGLCEQFGIDLPDQMTVEVVTQAKLARRLGSKFVPTKYFDARPIGVAINRSGKYGIIVENGIPRICLVATCAHELTHIWQYSHWNAVELKAKYGDAMLAVSEGMAKWAEIQYLYLINEAAQAERELEHEVARTDVYGYGLRLFLHAYPLSKGVVLEGDTPFSHITEPLP